LPPCSQFRSNPGATALRPLDLAVIAVYFVATIGVGMYVSRNQRTAGDYFLGARDLPAWAILLAIVAAETSALTVISVPAVAARGDLTFLQVPLGYLIGRIVVAAWLLPGYFTGQQDTAYARLEHRFGVGTRRLTSVIFLATRLLGDGVRIYASAIPLAVLTGWSVPASILAMSIVTLFYTWHGGLKAVVWVDVVQLVVYVAGGVAALWIAMDLAGGAGSVFAMAGEAGKLRIIDPTFNFSHTYTLLGGLIGGGMLSAASHGTDQLIVQRLLASRSLRAARTALVGSGVLVLLQFTLFLLIGTSIWAAGLAPADVPADQLFSRFVISHLPTGLAGLVVAAILAAAMSTHSSAINALASSVTHDLYAGWTGRTDPAHLLRVGRLWTMIWGVLTTIMAIVFNVIAGGGQRPVVDFALAIASITYGGLLGAFILAGKRFKVDGTAVAAGIGTAVTIMLLVFFSKWLAVRPGLAFLLPASKLAWPWYVPLGTSITLLVGLTAGLLRKRV
jgi:SSS family solute:Na+ symporter